MKPLETSGLALLLAFNAMVGINTAHTVLQGGGIQEIEEQSIALKAVNATAQTFGKVCGDSSLGNFAAGAVKIGGTITATFAGAPGLLIGGAVGLTVDEGKEIGQSPGPR